MSVCVCVCVCVQHWFMLCVIQREVGRGISSLPPLLVPLSVPFMYFLWIRFVNVDKWNREKVLMLIWKWNIWKCIMLQPCFAVKLQECFVDDENNIIMVPVQENVVKLIFSGIQKSSSSSSSSFPVFLLLHLYFLLLPFLLHFHHLQKCFVDDETSPEFPSAGRWGADEYIFIFRGNCPFNGFKGVQYFDTVVFNTVLTVAVSTDRRESLSVQLNSFLRHFTSQWQRLSFTSW